MKTAQYAVFSYDPDEQQHFCDYLRAPDPGRAAEMILDSRPEVQGAAAYSADELREIATSLDSVN